MPDDRKPRIIDVTRKPIKCPDCGERVVDIVYGTGDMTEIEFALQYRKEAIMGGDNIHLVVLQYGVVHADVRGLEK